MARRDPPETSVTWSQTRAFRMERMHLAAPLGSRSLRRVVRDLGGVQAQVASAATLQCAVRCDGLSPGAPERALWKSRTLVKTWGMRGTLHWIDADDLPIWAAAFATRGFWKRPVWQRTFKLSVADVEALVDAVAGALDGNCLTRTEVADAVQRDLSDSFVDEHLRSGWGSALKLVALHGKLCFGPDRGRNVTFVRPDQWVDGWHEFDVDEAIAEVCRRYLHSHGPATREEFARWWGFSPPDASKVLDALGDEVVVVDREGDTAYVHRSDLKALEVAEEDDGVRLLGMFDAYVLAGLPHDPIVPKKHKDKVFRTGAWVSQTVLRGGRVVGVWTQDRKAKGTQVDVDLFQRRAVTRSMMGEQLDALEPYIGPVSGLSLT